MLVCGLFLFIDYIVVSAFLLCLWGFAEGRLFSNILGCCGTWGVTNIVRRKFKTVKLV
jgi:hypothetical protein